MLIDISKLNQVGYVTLNVPEIQGWEDGVFEEITKTFGGPIPHSNGSLKFNLTARDDGLKGTYSEKFGKGKFPFHSDGAWLPIPPQYIVLCKTGVRIRPTLLCSFNVLRSEINVDFYSAIFSVRHGYGRRPVPILSTASGKNVWRWDEMCMYPQNGAAKRIASTISHVFENSDELISIDWSKFNVLIFNNWNLAHSRGECSVENENWILKRMLIGAHNVLE